MVSDGWYRALYGTAKPSSRSHLRRLTTFAPYRLLQQTYAVPLLIALLVGLLSVINHLPGVDWGDDFALYMRQAKAITTGNVDDVVRDTRFTVDNSGWHTFSHYSYPWGWPLLVAPFYALFGLDYEVFKLIEVVALCLFLLLFFAIVRRRAGLLPATILTLVIGLSPAFVGATGTVLSDLPYLCFVGLSLWWMDRCHIRGVLRAGWQRLVILGLLVAYTYSIRREGVALLFSLAALQIAVLVRAGLRARSVKALREVKWRQVFLPYIAFGAGVAAFFVLLPTALLPNAPGAGLQNIPFRVAYFDDILAEHVGLKDPGLPMELFGSEVAARGVLVLLVILAAVGLIGRLLDRFEEDVALGAYLVGMSFIMLISPYEEGRYLLTVTPLLAYFAYQALPTIGHLVSGRRALVALASVFPLLAFAGLSSLNARDLVHSTRYHLDYEYIMHGPESPDAQQMFQAVRELTRPNDVILFFRARAMTLYTDRPAIQGSNLDQMLERADWYVMAKGSTYSQKLLSRDEARAYGLTNLWENEWWVMWRVPRHGS